MEGHAIDLGSEDACRIVRDIVFKGNEAEWQRTLVKNGASLTELVRRQAALWAQDSDAAFAPEVGPAS